MNRLYAVAILVLITAAVALSGCSGILDMLPLKDATPTPYVIHNPINSPSPTPTPAPEVSAAPLVIKPEPSNAVIILPWPASDYKMYSWTRTLNGQSENMTLIMENTDTKPVKNVIVTLSMTDTQTGSTVAYQEFHVGDLDRGQYKIFYAITSPHSDSYLINAHAKVIWGQNSEYFSQVDYKFLISAYA